MQVCAGHVHTLALTEDGEVFAWGNNKTGCVGCEERGTCAPQRVEGLKGKRVVAIAAGMELASNGDVYAWGQGLQGQTANEKKVDTNIPHAIDALKGYGIKQIAAGGSHSAVVDDKGRVFMVGKKKAIEG